MKLLANLLLMVLAGTTTGAGTAFGWFPDEKSPTPEATPPAVILSASDANAAELEQELIRRLAADEASDFDIQIIGDLPSSQPRAIILQALQPEPSSQRRIAEQLERVEHSARELEQQGDSAEAARQRQIAQKLRAALPQVTIKIVEDSPESKMLPESMAPHREREQISVLERELQNRARQSQAASDPKDREQLALEIRNLKIKLDHLRDQARNQRQPEGEQAAHQREARERAQIRGTLESVAELRTIAHSLQQSGHRDQAQAIREVAEQLAHAVHEQAERPFRSLESPHRMVHPGFGPIAPRVQTPDPRPAGLPRHHENPREQLRHSPADRADDHGPRPPHQPHADDMAWILRDLQHEVARLRGEVHDLTAALQHGRRPDNRDREEREHHDRDPRDHRRDDRDSQAR